MQSTLSKEFGCLLEPTARRLFEYVERSFEEPVTVLEGIGAADWRTENILFIRRKDCLVEDLFDVTNTKDVFMLNSKGDHKA